jgi:hypothetical protein
MFISTRQFRRKQKSINRPEIKTPQPFTNSYNQSDQSADMSLESKQAHFRTFTLAIALKQAAHDYFYATKPRVIASINFAKAWQDSGEHCQRWIDKPVIIRLLRAEMAAINREFGGILDDGAALH